MISSQEGRHLSETNSCWVDQAGVCDLPLRINIVGIVLVRFLST